MDFLKYRADLLKLLETYKKGDLDDGDFVREILKLMADVEYSRLQECMRTCQVLTADIIAPCEYGLSRLRT